MTREEAALTEAALAREKEQEADARRRASILFKAMRNPGGDQARELPREDYRRRRDKEPAASRSHEAEEVTPLEHRAQHHTPPTRPYGGARPSIFRPTTPGVEGGTYATASQSQRQRDPMTNTPWGLLTAA